GHRKGYTFCTRGGGFRALWFAITDRGAARTMDRSRLDGACRLLTGPDSVATLVTDPDVDIVVSAIVGSAGLLGTWAALEKGKTVAFANKEKLVMAGPLVMDLGAPRGGRPLPVDKQPQANLP